MPSGLFTYERDHLITLSFVCFYALLPPVTRVLGLGHIGSRKVHRAGVTPHPNEAWMVQVARNVTMEEWGCLSPGQYLIHDRDLISGHIF